MLGRNWYSLRVIISFTPLKDPVCSLFRHSFVDKATHFVVVLVRLVTKTENLQKVKEKKDDPDVIRTRNLLIWSQTRCRCATESPC